MAFNSRRAWVALGLALLSAMEAMWIGAWLWGGIWNVLDPVKNVSEFSGFGALLRAAIRGFFTACAVFITVLIVTLRRYRPENAGSFHSAAAALAAALATLYLPGLLLRFDQYGRHPVSIAAPLDLWAAFEWSLGVLVAGMALVWWRARKQRAAEAAAGWR
jgi:hypothetical protein